MGTPWGALGLGSSRRGEGGQAGGGLELLAGVGGEEQAEGGLEPRDNDCKFSFLNFHFYVLVTSYFYV
jgi:hypothetical protein